MPDKFDMAALTLCLLGFTTLMIAYAVHMGNLSGGFQAGFWIGLLCMLFSFSILVFLYNRCASSLKEFTGGVEVGLPEVA